MKLTLDFSRCIGHGTCYSLFPDLLHADDEGYSILRRSEVPPELAVDPAGAIANCPADAIGLKPDNT